MSTFESGPNSTGSGPFAPEVNHVLGESFGESLDDITVERGQGDAARALDAHAYTIGNTIALGDGVREDVTDPASMEILAHEVSHALGGGGGGGGKLVDDGRGDAGEHGAYAAGGAFRDYIAGGATGRAPRLAPTASTAMIHRSEAGEHAHAVDNAAKNARIDPESPVAKQIARQITLSNGVTLSQGEISALMGDFYGAYKKDEKDPSKETFDALGSFEALDQADPKEMQQLLTYVRREKASVEGALHGNNEFHATENGLLEKATKNRTPRQTSTGSTTGYSFMDLAQKNSSHFSGADEASQDTNMGAYGALHAEALSIGQEVAGLAPDDPHRAALEQRALALEASSQHFMVDRFSAGHQFDKPKMVEEGRAQVATQTGIGPLDAATNWLGDKWGNLHARVIHNRLNSGENADGTPNTATPTLDNAGQILGDSHWADGNNAITRARAGTATVESYGQLDAVMGGANPASVNARPSTVPKWDEKRNQATLATGRGLSFGEVAEAEIPEAAGFVPLLADTIASSKYTEPVHAGLQVASRLSPSLGALGPLASLGVGAAQTISSVSDIQDRGLTGENAVGLGTGGLDMLSGGAALAGAGPLAAVAGAGATGLKIGTAINNLTESSSKGHFGRDEQGRERTAQDEAVDQGLATEAAWKKDGHGDTMAFAAGAASSVGHGLYNVADNAMSHLWNAVGHWTE